MSHEVLFSVPIMAVVGALVVVGRCCENPRRKVQPPHWRSVPQVHLDKRDLVTQGTEPR